MDTHEHISCIDTTPALEQYEQQQQSPVSCQQEGETGEPRQEEDEQELVLWAVLHRPLNKGALRTSIAHSGAHCMVPQTMSMQCTGSVCSVVGTPVPASGFSASNCSHHIVTGQPARPLSPGALVFARFWKMWSQHSDILPFTALLYMSCWCAVTFVDDNCTYCD